MSCQRAITSKIAEKEANYVLSLKENQPLPCAEVKEYFADVKNSPKKYPEVKMTKTNDKGC